MENYTEKDFDEMRKLLIDSEIDNYDFGNIEDIFKYGYEGILNYDDDELVDTFECYFSCSFKEYKEEE